MSRTFDDRPSSFRGTYEIQSIILVGWQAYRASHVSFRLHPRVRCTKDLADSVDLRTKDAFGRNPLYYTCLCGHVCAAHFVVIRAYGGVEVRRSPSNPPLYCYSTTTETCLENPQASSWSRFMTTWPFIPTRTVCVKRLVKSTVSPTLQVYLLHKPPAPLLGAHVAHDLSCKTYATNYIYEFPSDSPSHGAIKKRRHIPLLLRKRDWWCGHGEGR